MIIDGNAIAQKILDELKTLPVPKKEFAAVLVGDDSASLSFLKQKEKTAQWLGVQFKLYQISTTHSQEEVEKAVRDISVNPKVGAVIVQLPLPKQYDRVGVLNAIGIEKDVDVLNGESSKVLAPAAGALKRILEEINFDLAGKKAVVVGPGILIGRPIINWLTDKVESVAVIRRGGYSAEITRDADLLIAGTGVPSLIKAEHVKPGAVVIDFGYGRDENNELAGDVDCASIAKVAHYVTPTPGGTGPIVVAQLFANFYQLAKSL